MFNEEINTKNWNNYFIEGTNVLKNKLGITDRETLLAKETEITFQRLLELHIEPICMDFDERHLQAIHYYLFGDIYEFAGKYRNVNMEKNHSYFASVDEIEFRLKELFKLMELEVKGINSKYQFACFLAEYYAQLLNVHPFREGNGRTIREFIREYANEKSKSLPFGEIHFSWNNVDKEVIESLIDKSVVFRSAIELEFMKALEPVEKDNSYNR